MEVEGEIQVTVEEEIVWGQGFFFFFFFSFFLFVLEGGGGRNMTL